MILSNVKKFEFLQKDAHCYRKLVQEIVQEVSPGQSKVLLCPKLGSLYTWWLPESSVNNDNLGRWSKLKTIEYTSDGRVSLWDRQTLMSCHPDIRKIVEERLNIYVVPMSDVVYSLITPYNSEPNNFRVFINNYDQFYSTNLVNKSDELMVVSSPTDYTGTLYSLETNQIVYDVKVPVTQQLDDWHEVENDEGWGVWSPSDQSTFERLNQALPDSPKTPTTPACHKNLMNDFDLADNETHNNRMTMSILDDYDSFDSSAEESMAEESMAEESSAEESMAEESMAEESMAEESMAEDEQGNQSETSDHDSEYNSEDDSDYIPDVDTFEDDSTSVDDYDYMDEYYDEKRKDIDGRYYTRRQFYDYYGTDESWDNLDPSVYHKHRFDENNGKWYTKEEFYQWYGSDTVWKKMSPKKRLKRMAIERAYWYASYLPPRLQDGFLKKFLDTY